MSEEYAGPPSPKPLFWIASSRKDLREFPKEIRRTFGRGLYAAQRGGRHPDSKVLKGFGGASVLELIEDAIGSTYRAVYTVKFATAVYVLHAFQKKSKAGIKTSPVDINRIRERLRRAEEQHAKWIEDQESHSG